jgi:hypothetical protein
MATWRQIEAEERRQQREAQRRQRDLERRAREQAKSSAEERARLEVETYENRLEALLSVHKAQGDTWDWAALAASLPPPPPEEGLEHELRAQQRLLVSSPQQRSWAETELLQARSEDAKAFQEAERTYGGEKAHWEKMNGLARRILAGEHKAYIEALVEFSPLAEISELGSSVNFTVHSAKLIEAALKVNGMQAIPSEVKTLTAAGRVSAKAMPKGRFHEAYQDYVCGCVLRVAREVFALLPVETVLITAFVDAVDARTGQTMEQPVLSAVMPRAVASRLDFDRLDPSDSFGNFLHRGDFKASRKTEAFLPIVPLAVTDIPQNSEQRETLDSLVVRCRKLREELSARTAEISPASVAPIPQSTEPP